MKYSAVIVLVATCWLSCALLAASSPCPPGFVTVTGSAGCFLFNPNNLNWFDAERHCNSLGAHLTSISSLAEQQSLTLEVVATNGFGSSRVWLGANDISADNVWTWIDGSAWSYSNWCPSMAFNLAAQCGFISPTCNGRWDHLTCSSTLPSICKHSGSAVVTSPVFNPNATCPAGYTYHFDTCLRTTYFQGTFEGFKVFCADNGNGHIAIIPTLVHNRWFYEYIRAWSHTGSAYFIGAVKVPAPAYWEWYLDHSTVAYSVWDAGQPDNTFGSEGCVTFNGNGNGKWNDFACDWNAFALCQTNTVVPIPSGAPTAAPTSPTMSPTLFPTNGPTISPTRIPTKIPTISPTATPVHQPTVAPTRAPCPAGFVAVFGLNDCYKVYTNLANWFEAERTCNSVGAHLASITSYQEGQTLYQNLIYQSVLNSPEIWIGGHDLSAENAWKWIDGKPFSYTRWGNGEPNNALETEQCVALMLSWNVLWNDAVCGNTKPFLCKHADNGTTVSSPVYNDKIAPCPLGYNYHFNTCLMVKTAVAGSTSFEGMKTWCATNGNGKLVVMPTLETNRWFYEYVIVYGGTGLPYFIGMVKQSNTWMWYTNNAAVSYSNWAPGQPDGSIFGDSCAVFPKNGKGTWSDVSCSSTTAYVLCQAPVVDLTPTAPPTVMPTSTPTMLCPAGSASIGTGGRCALCPAGSFSISPNAAYCTGCPRGSYATSEGSTECTKCPTGRYGLAVNATSAATCAPCVPGTYSWYQGAAECTRCSPGYYTEEYEARTCKYPPEDAVPINFDTTNYDGATSYQQCAAPTFPQRSYVRGVGNYYYYAFIFCGPCALGQYYDKMYRACMACEAGTFTDGFGATSCEQCVLYPERYADVRGMDRDFCLDDQLQSFTIASAIALVVYFALLLYFVGFGQADRLAMWRKTTLSTLKGEAVALFLSVDAMKTRLVQQAVASPRLNEVQTTLPDLVVLQALSARIGYSTQKFLTPLSALLAVGISVLYQMLSRYGQILFAVIIVHRNTHLYLAGESLRHYLQEAMLTMEHGFGNLPFYSLFGSVFEAAIKLSNATVFTFLEDTDLICSGMQKAFYLLVVLVIYLPIHVFVLSEYMDIQGSFVDTVETVLARLLGEMTLLRNRANAEELSHLTMLQRWKALWFLCLDRLVLNVRVMAKLVSYCIGFIVFTPFVSYHGMAGWTEKCNHVEGYPGLANVDTIIAAVTTAVAYLFMMAIVYLIVKAIVPKSVRAEKLMIAEEARNVTAKDRQMHLLPWVPTPDMAFVWHWNSLHLWDKDVFQDRSVVAGGAFYAARQLSVEDWKKATKGQLPGFGSFVQSCIRLEYFSVFLVNLWTYLKAAVGYWDQAVLVAFNLQTFRREWKREEARVLSARREIAEEARPSVPPLVDEEIGDSLNNNDNHNSSSPSSNPYQMLDPSAPPMPSEDAVPDNSLIQEETPQTEVPPPVSPDTNRIPAPAAEAGVATVQEHNTCSLDQHNMYFKLMESQLVLRGALLLFIPYGALISIFAVFTGSTPLLVDKETTPQTFALDEYLDPLVHRWNSAMQEADAEFKQFAGNQPFRANRDDLLQHGIPVREEHYSLAVTIWLERSRIVQWGVGVLQYFVVLAIVFFPTPPYLVAAWYALLVYAVLSSGRVFSFALYWGRLVAIAKKPDFHGLPNPPAGQRFAPHSVSPQTVIPQTVPNTYLVPPSSSQNSSTGGYSNLSGVYSGAQPNAYFSNINQPAVTSTKAVVPTAMAVGSAVNDRYSDTVVFIGEADVHVVDEY